MFFAYCNRDFHLALPESTLNAKNNPQYFRVFDVWKFKELELKFLHYASSSRLASGFIVLRALYSSLCLPLGIESIWHSYALPVVPLFLPATRRPYNWAELISEQRLCSKAKKSQINFDHSILFFREYWQGALRWISTIVDSSNGPCSTDPLRDPNTATWYNIVNYTEKGTVGIWGEQLLHAISFFHETLNDTTVKCVSNTSMRLVADSWYYYFVQKLAKAYIIFLTAICWTGILFGFTMVSGYCSFWFVLILYWLLIFWFVSWSDLSDLFLTCKHAPI